MPEMENLNECSPFADSIIDQDWGVDERADAVSSVHRTADVRELFQEIDVIEDSSAESLCTGGKNVPRIG